MTAPRHRALLLAFESWAASNYYFRGPTWTSNSGGRSINAHPCDRRRSIGLPPRSIVLGRRWVPASCAANRGGGRMNERGAQRTQEAAHASLHPAARSPQLRLRRLIDRAAAITRRNEHRTFPPPQSQTPINALNQSITGACCRSLEGAAEAAPVNRRRCSRAYVHASDRQHTAAARRPFAASPAPTPGPLRWQQQNRRRRRATTRRTRRPTSRSCSRCGGGWIDVPVLDPFVVRSSEASYLRHSCSQLVQHTHSTHYTATAAPSR